MYRAIELGNPIDLENAILNGADVNAANPLQRKFRMSDLIHFKFASNARSDGSPAILKACECNHRFTLIHVLVMNGARVPVGATGERLFSLLMQRSPGRHGCYEKYECKQAVVIGELLDAGISPDNCDQSELSYVGAAVNWNDTRVADVLLKHGADPTAGLVPPLVDAAFLDKPQMAALLLSYGAKDVSIRGFPTARDVAQRKHNILVLKVLNRGSNPKLPMSRRVK